MSGLDGKVALVTGGASGLGKAIALRLSSDGAAVTISDVQVELGNAVADAHGFVFLEHDVREEERWQHIVHATEARFEKLDILVNNAGIAAPASAMTPENASLEDWNRIFAVNAAGVFLGCKTVIPAMRRTGSGSIVNISSTSALVATSGATPYGASKAAVRQLTKSVAQYCAEKKLNIRCNSVHPGIARTPLWDKFAVEVAKQRGISFDEFVSESAARIPLGDMTRAEDVAASVAFLASDESRHITGTKIVVDGGMTNCQTVST